MALQLVERPYEIAFSRNPIRYVIQTNTALATDGLRIDVRLFFRHILEPGFVQIIELSLKPDSSGLATVDFNKVLDSLVNYELPTVTGLTIARAFEQVGEYYIDYREATTATPSPGWTSDLSNSRKCIKGGLPYEKWQGPNFFIYNQSFLTWQKSERYIGPKEKSWLTYLHLGTNNQASMTAKVNLYFTDGSSQINAVTLAFPDAAVPKYGIYRIPIGVRQLFLDDINTAKVIQYYTVRVLAVAVQVTPEYYFEVDYRGNYSSTTLHFFNSLGGFDSMALLGDVEKEARYDSQSAEVTVSDTLYNTNELSPAQFTQQVIEQMVYKGSVGLMDDNDRFDRIRDLRISKGVYQVKFKRWWPVNLLNNSIQMGSDSDPVKDFPLEWTYGFVNENYAPDLNIGYLPACPLITGLASSLGVVTWSGSASHVQYIVERWDVFQTACVETIYTNLLTVTFGFGIIGYVRVKAVCGYSNSEFSDFIYIL